MKILGSLQKPLKTNTQGEITKHLKPPATAETSSMYVSKKIDLSV